jgi:hypothetical protein
LDGHTQLWDFQKNKYHEWVYAERLQKKFPPIYRADKIVRAPLSSRRGVGVRFIIGIGLHDSSAALIPYLKLFDEPFILHQPEPVHQLRSFNDSALTHYEFAE